MPFAKSIKITFSILLILLLTSPVNEGLSALSGKNHSGSGKNHALIIGISNYDEWPKLESPVKDAEEIAKILTEKYNFKKSNITILTDTTKEKPEKDIILDFLDNYLKKLTEQDNFLVFFQATVKKTMREKLTGYLKMEGKISQGPGSVTPNLAANILPLKN